MTASITLPLWVVLILSLLALWAMLDRLLMPSVRWFVRRSTNRIIDELNVRLQIGIQPFQRTKRQVLIDRLMYDPKVQAAAEAYARAHEVPHAVVMATVRRYAQEIVPAFNAYVYFRLGYWLSRKAAQLLYRVRLGYADHAGLSAIAPNATIVFVMNHRSNMDYILVAYLAADQTALSYAVGECGLGFGRYKPSFAQWEPTSYGGTREMTCTAAYWSAMWAWPQPAGCHKHFTRRAA